MGDRWGEGGGQKSMKYPQWWGQRESLRERGFESVLKDKKKYFSRQGRRVGMGHSKSK